LFDLPLVIGIVFYLWGIMVFRFDTVAISSSSNNTTTIQTDVQFIGELLVPGFILLMRQIVIAVKYAYIPRAHVRSDRADGRNMSQWQDELMVQWCFLPNARMITHNAKLACERARIDPYRLVIEFAKPFQKNEWDIFRTPETNEQQKIFQQASVDLASVASDMSHAAAAGDTNDNGSLNDSKTSSSNDNITDASATLPSSSKIDLWKLLHYSVYNGTFQSKGIGIPPFMLMGVAGAMIPVLFRAYVLQRPAFGSTSFDKWICACSFLSYTMEGSGAVWVFSYCAVNIFNRARRMQDVYFEFLVPQTVPDARIRDPPLKVKGAKRFPDLVQSAENVYAWNLGRHALRQVGVFYSLRVQAFLGLYIFMTVVGILFFLIQSVIVVSNGKKLQVTAGMLSLGFLSVSFLMIFLNIILAGIRANRQNKLHKSAIEHYRTRLAHHVKEQAGEMRRRVLKLSTDGGGSDSIHSVKQAELEARLKELLRREKELQTALKHVGNEMDCESEVEKLRIMGFAVDSRMLEGVLGLVSATVLTLWQVFGD